jgi:hypothetical protein
MQYRIGRLPLSSRESKHALETEFVYWFVLIASGGSSSAGSPETCELCVTSRSTNIASLIPFLSRDDEAGSLQCNVPASTQSV